MRIVMTADAVGGIWQYALDLAEELAARGVQIVLAVLGPRPGAEQEREARAINGLVLIPTDLPLDWLARNASEVRRTARAIASLAHQEWADLVHLNSPSLAAAGAHYDVPVLAACHSCVATWWNAVKDAPLPPDFVWRAELVRAGLRAADAIVAPSQAFAETLRTTYRLQQAPAAVHNGRKLSAGQPEGTAGGGKPFVFAAGRLWDEGKNVAALDRAAGHVAIRVVVAGPVTGPNGANVVLDHAEALGGIHGDEVRAWLSRQPIFVSTSLYEPFGLAVLEAAQAGCPLVLSDIPTFRELWDGAAEFVSAKDDLAIAGVIDRLAGDPSRREELSVAARARARHYTVTAMADEILGLYRSLVHSPQPAGWMAA